MCKRLEHPWACGCTGFQWIFCHRADEQDISLDRPCHKTAYDPADPNRNAKSSTSTREAEYLVQCCSTRCCQESMNSTVYKMWDLEDRYDIPPEGSWKDRSKKIGDVGKDMQNFYHNARGNIERRARHHIEVCFQKHASGNFFTNELKHKNGEEPSLPTIFQVPDRPEIPDELRQRCEEMVSVWLNLETTKNDISYYHKWQQANQGNIVRAPAPPLGQRGAAAVAMGMARSAKAPAMDRLLATELDSVNGVVNKIASAKARALMIMNVDFTSSLRDRRGREAALDASRYDILRVEHNMTEPNCNANVASNSVFLYIELFRAITVINSKRTELDTITTPPPPSDPQNLQQEVLNRYPGFRDGNKLLGSIQDLGVNVNTMIPAPQAPQTLNVFAVQTYAQGLSAWMQYLDGLEEQFKDMEIASWWPTVAPMKGDIDPALHNVRAAILQKRRSAFPDRQANVYGGGGGGGDDNPPPPPPPPPPDTDYGQGGRFQQGPGGGGFGLGGVPYTGKGKDPVYRGGGGGDGGYSGGSGYDGLYQASDHHGLSSHAAIASDKKTDTRTASTQIRNSAANSGSATKSPSRLPVPIRPPGNGGKKTTAGIDTTTSRISSAPSNSTDPTAHSSNISTSEGTNNKPSKRGIQSSASESVNNTRKPIKTKNSQTASAQDMQHQANDRIKKSLKEVRFDGGTESDYVKKGSNAAASEGRRKA